MHKFHARWNRLEDNRGREWCQLWESVGKAKSGPKPLDMVPPLLYLRPRRNPPWRGPPVPIPLRRKERNERKTEMKSTAQTPSRAKPIPRMRRDARATLRQRALAGDADAMCEYGGRLAEDPATREEGLAWEIRSAEAGACFGAFNAAMTCSMLGRPTECIRWLRRARRDGERSADLCLGVSVAPPSSSIGGVASAWSADPTSERRLRISRGRPASCSRGRHGHGRTAKCSRTRGVWKLGSPANSHCHCWH